MSKRTLWATFIGINAYRQNELNGCIKDVLDIDLLLRGQAKQQEDNLTYAPLYLLAPNEVDEIRIDDYNTAQAVELTYETPTFKNVSQKAFAHLKQSKGGDVCVLFYSGHGSQVDAPEVFWHTKPDRQNETIVCVDSRDPANPDSRDLIDKELAFLLWDALNGKAVHCLLVMDCCHSGNNTRAALTDASLRFRHISSSKNKVPLEKYLGYESGFYEIQNGKASIKIASYVHLAAARDNEKAQETIDGGLFTSRLTEALRCGGTAKSYRDLVQSLSISVRNRAEQQNPVAFASIDADLDQQFLGAGITPYKPSFEVRYDVVQQQWIMHGGALHGISPDANDDYTTIQIAGTDKEIKVVNVFAMSSVLDETAMSGLDTEKEYKAVLLKLATPVLKIDLSHVLFADETKREALKLLHNATPHLYYNINFEAQAPGNDYLVQLTQDDQYVLTKAGSEVPLFKREKEAVPFLQKLDIIGKWLNTTELTNANTSFSKDDFIFTLEKIEGIGIPERNPDSVSVEKKLIQPDEEILLSYKNGHAPGFRLSIAINPASLLKSCFIGALYMDSKFGITHDMIRDDANELKNEKESAVHLGVFSNSRFQKTIALEFDEKYSLYGINEITDFLKIFVSDKPFNLKRYQQDNLELDETPQVKMKGLKTTKMGNDPADKTDWAVFTNRIRIVGQNKEKKLKPGVADFALFKIEVPDGFEAMAFAATAEDQIQKLTSTGTRGMNEKEGVLSAAIMPPVNIWGETITDETPFAKGLNMGADNGVQVLELIAVKEGESLKIPDGKSLIIKPAASPGYTRPINSNLERTFIPYGFDPESRLYFPIGYADETGAIHIQQLPPATPGNLQNNAAQTRSLHGSVKLFFKKIFKPKEVTKLMLYEIDSNGLWNELAHNPKDIKGHLSGKAGSDMLLLLHGIMGDSRYMTEALKDMKGMPSNVQFALTYDYETLATPVAKAAEDLEKNLNEAGFGNASPILTVIAHSTGGLVARWLIEKGNGHNFVKHLILIGTPNAGTEISKITVSLFGLLTHALNVTGPIKYAITGLSFLLKKVQLDPTRILKDMEPGSQLLQDLAASSPPGNVRYSVIGGDMGLLKSYSGDDYFLKKIANALTTNFIYPGLTHLFNGKPNDMAVSVSSMQAIAGFDASANMRMVASDHLAYFKEPDSLKEIATFIQ